MRFRNIRLRPSKRPKVLVGGPQKEIGGKPRVILVEAEELAFQETEENKRFYERVGANKTKAWNRHAWGGGKNPRKATGEGRKF